MHIRRVNEKHCRGLHAECVGSGMGAASDIFLYSFQASVSYSRYDGRYSYPPTDHIF